MGKYGKRRGKNRVLLILITINKESVMVLDRDYPVLTKSEVNGLVEKGYICEKDKNLLILSLVPLVRHIAKRHTYYEREELTSIGLLKLVKEVNKLGATTATATATDNFCRHIGNCVYGAMLDYVLRKNSVIRNKQKNGVLIKITVISLKEDIEDHHANACNGFEVQDFFNSIVKSEKEREILKGLVCGYTMKEIGKKLNMTKANVSRIKIQIQKRIKEIEDV
jgi:RNA polymerase sigma factor (sigma-70 family)